jgi:hypothetical protein
MECFHRQWLFAVRTNLLLDHNPYAPTEGRLDVPRAFPRRFLNRQQSAIKLSTLQSGIPKSIKVRATYPGTKPGQVQCITCEWRGRSRSPHGAVKLIKQSIRIDDFLGGPIRRLPFPICTPFHARILGNVIQDANLLVVAQAQLGIPPFRQLLRLVHFHGRSREVIGASATVAQMLGRFRRGEKIRLEA